MKTRTSLARFCLLAFATTTVFSVNSILAETKSTQGTRFEILSGDIEVIAIYKNPPDLLKPPEKEESDDSPFIWPEFNLIVKAKDTSFTIPTTIIGGIRSVEGAVKRIKEGTGWKDAYLFVPSECGGGTSWHCNTAEVFTVRDDQLIRIGSIAGEYENGLFYDVYSGLESNELTSHASAPYIITVMREVGGRFVVDLDLTWKKNDLRYRPADKNGRGETFVPAMLFNAALAKYCDRKEELARFIEEAKAHLDADQFSRFNKELSRVKPGQPPGE